MLSVDNVSSTFLFLQGPFPLVQVKFYLLALTIQNGDTIKYIITLLCWSRVDLDFIIFIVSWCTQGSIWSHLGTGKNARLLSLVFEITSCKFSIRIYATQWSLRSKILRHISTHTLFTWWLWLWLNFTKWVSIARFGPTEIFGCLRSHSFAFLTLFLIFRVSLCYSCNWCFSDVWES